MDALSCNPTSLAYDDENFVNEIQDMQMFRETRIHTWIGRRCFRHQEIIASKFKIPQFLVVELEEHDVRMGLTKGQIGDQVSRDVVTSPTQQEKKEGVNSFKKNDLFD